MNTAHKIAHRLLNINAIKINLKDPFTWASGWKSPIYCDNRISLSDPEVRGLIRDEYVHLIRAKYPDVQVIAGVATGAIPQGALVADQLNLPFIYVRDKPKDHGLKKIIEGASPKGKKVVVLEDHISTGGSSLKVVDELKKEAAEVLGMVAVFTYEFDTAVERFRQAGCELSTLSTYTTLVEQALADHYITAEDVQELTRWHNAPDQFFT